MLQVVTNRDSCQYREEPINTWEDHNRNIHIHVDHNIPIVILPGSDWSFQILTRVLLFVTSWSTKKILGSTFVLRRHCIIWGPFEDQQMSTFHDTKVPCCLEDEMFKKSWNCYLFIKLQKESITCLWELFLSHLSDYFQAIYAYCTHKASIFQS